MAGETDFTNATFEFLEEFAEACGDGTGLMGFLSKAVDAPF